MVLTALPLLLALGGTPAPQPRAADAMDGMRIACVTYTPAETKRIMGLRGALVLCVSGSEVLGPVLRGGRPAQWVRGVYDGECLTLTSGPWLRTWCE